MTFTGKFVHEDCGKSNGRTDRWPAIPRNLSKSYATSGSTTIVCVRCGSATGGLRYNADADQFEHRDHSRCEPGLSLSAYRRKFPEWA